MKTRKIVLILILLFALVNLKAPSAHADFNSNSIIDDNIFNNAGSMSAAQIDSFLNGFPSSCISSSNGFTSPEPTGYTPSGGYTYGSNVSAGKIIYDLSYVYGINPQVLLATLQKEQSLVTGSAGCYTTTPDPNNTFQCNLWGTGNIPCTSACPYSGGCIPIALGNNCPGNCQASTEGFSKQLTTAAWKLKYWQQRSEGNVNWDVQVRDFPYAGNVWDNSDDVTSGSSTYCYSGLRMTQGYFQLCPNGSFATYDGLSTVHSYSGGPAVTVHLDNGATAALYNWTPFISGNQNFYNIFYNWFVYQAQPVGQASYPVIKQGQTASVYIRYKNTGGATWYDDVSAPGSGNLPVHLATDYPLNRQSPFSSSWPAGNRAGMVFDRVYNNDMSLASNQHIAAPGQIVEYWFAFNAPWGLSPGTYSEAFRPVVEWYGPMNDTGTYFNVTVNAWSYKAQAAGQSVYPSFKQGENSSVYLRYKNTGNDSWYDDVSAPGSGNLPVHLATDYPLNRQSPFSSSWPAGNRAAQVFSSVYESDGLTLASNQHIAAPGQIVEFKFSLSASLSAAVGAFNEAFRPVVEWYGPMNDTGTYLSVSIGKAVYSAQAAAQSNYPTIAKGGSAPVFLRYKNTGNVAWYDDSSAPSVGELPVHLATDYPLNRQSPFSSSWPYPHRPALLFSKIFNSDMTISSDQHTVQPGQYVEFWFAFDAPSGLSTGTYTEGFRPVIEGFGPLNDTGTYFKVTVTN